METTLERLEQEGNDAYYTSNDNAALQKWQAGLNQARVLDNEQYISQFLGKIGMVYADLEQYQQALGYFKETLTIKRKIGDSHGEGHALTDIGNMYNYLGQYKRALEYYKQALEIRRELGDRSREGEVLFNISVTYYICS